jgi:hypothetical protein
MKKPLFLIFLSLAILPASIMIVYKYHYTEFTPLAFDGNDFINLKQDPGFNRNIKKVLRYYRISCKEGASGTLLVQQRVNNDKELVWNMCNKALDTLWLKQHP